MIYEVPRLCGDVYVGETKRSLEIWLKEHHGAAERGELEKSALAEHAWEAGHVIVWELARVVEMVKNTTHHSWKLCRSGRGHHTTINSQHLINRDAGVCNYQNSGVQLSEQWCAIVRTVVSILGVYRFSSLKAKSETVCRNGLLTLLC